jgi:hypothetical protein
MYETNLHCCRRNTFVGAPFEEGFSFAVEKPAGPMRKRSLHYTEAPDKNISTRTLNFSQINHQTHS